MASLIATGLLAAACSSNRLEQATLDQASSDLQAHLRIAGLEIDEDSLECSVGQFDGTTAEALATDELGGSDASTVAEAVVDCGRGKAGLGPLLRPVVDAEPASLDCAVGELDDEVITHMLASALGGSDGLRSADEAQVATALSLCLSPEELLDFPR